MSRGKAVVFGAKPPERQKDHRIAVRIPKGMVNDIQDTMNKQGLSYRFRSKWISFAIVWLERIPQFWDSVAEEWIEAGGNELVSIVLNEVTRSALDREMEIVRERFPGIDDIQSKVVRTAIMQLLIGGPPKIIF
jgi:hypothetical protein